MNDNINDAFALIEQGVRDVRNSEQYKAYLSFVSKFHPYSFNNVLLILSQKPDATLVAGYQCWKHTFHRYVRKGEKAIRILAPCPYKIKNEQDKEEEIMAYKVVHVFDVSQTDGEHIPEPLHELSGTSKEVQALIKTVENICNCPISYRSRDEDQLLANGSKGYFNPLSKQIVVEKDCADLQKAKTLLHEFAHSRLHQGDEKERFVQEIEAESLAFVIAHHFGLDTSDYSFGYIAGFAEKQNDRLKEILSSVHEYAQNWIQQMEPDFYRFLNA